ncbi:MAG: hypothetical protein GX376_08075, partial [Firmicutes bacterium]|nr:hypothetical protein [Bacillota bacterium]
MKKYLIWGLIFILCLALWLPVVQAEEAGDSNNIEENGDGEDTKEDEEYQRGFQPSLVIESIRADEAVAGGEFYLTLTIRNWSKHLALNVTPDLKVSKTDGMAPFAFKGEAPILNKIAGEGVSTMTIGLEVDANAVA